MKKQALLAAGLMALSAAAFAGYVQPAPVTVTVNADGSGFASGDMVSARFAPDVVTFIGCGARTVDTGGGTTFQFGFCQAGDGAGVQFTCFTENPVLLDQMHATADTSFIVFSWNAAGECTRVGFSTQSFYMPDFFKKSK